MTDNMEIWNKLKRPPPTALKTIAAGRLKGKSDINPQWRMEAITEAFGPCGIGWKYDVIDKQFITCGTEIVAILSIHLYVKHHDKWSEPIFGTGGKVMYVKERNGMYCNDEAVKMALTDALGVAMKSLGIAADIYAGLWDGTKYAEDPEEERKRDEENRKRKEAENKKKAFDAYMEKAGKSLAKYDVMALQQAFEEHGFVSNKDEKQEWLADVLSQVDSKEKIGLIGAKTKQLDEEISNAQAD